ncbi:MAG TPA: glycosyltransferase family 39 protein [Geobacteraceae bacterium]
MSGLPRIPSCAEVREKIRSSWPELLTLLAILGIAFGLRMVFLHEPFERDEGLYGYIGQEILRGAIPYRDMADLKPPGSFYIYATMIAVFGNSLEAIRVATGIYAMVTTLFVYLLARYIRGVGAGVCAGLLFAVFSGAPLLQGSSSNTEVFMLLPLVVSVYLCLRGVDSGQRLYLAGSGFFAGAAVMIKTIALPYAALIFVFIALRPGLVRQWKTRLGDLAAFLAPPVATALLTVAYFALHGALDDMYYWNVTIHKRYVEQDSAVFLLQMRSTIRFLLGEQCLLWFAGIGGGIWLLFSERNFRGLLIALLLPTSILGMALPGHFFPHYFIQLTPFFAVAGGLGFGRLCERKGIFLALAVPIVAIGLYLHVMSDYKFYLVYDPGTVSTVKYGGYPLFAQSVGIADYVRSQTQPSDYIIQWGWEPELYFYSNRRGLPNLTTFLAIEWSPDPEKAIREMLAAIAARKPKFIVVQDYMDALGLKELNEVIERDYYLDTRIDYARIFRRKDATR